MDEKKQPCCSFCGKQRVDVGKLIVIMLLL